MAGEIKLTTALILLPLSYNPDKEGKRHPVVEEKFNKTMEEVSIKFGGGLLDTRPRSGFWWSMGMIWQDEMAVLEVDF